MIRAIMNRLNLGQLLFAGSATTAWNWLTDSEIGVLIANVTGILIILLLLRKFLFALYEDITKLRVRTKKDQHDGLIADEGDVMKPAWPEQIKDTQGND